MGSSIRCAGADTAFLPDIDAVEECTEAKKMRIL